MSTHPLIRFALRFSLYIIIIVIIIAYPLYRLLNFNLLIAGAESLLFFFCLTMGAFAFITLGGADSKKMVNRYFVSVALKLLIALVYFVVMLQNFKGLELGFALSFFSSYLICTFFEIYYLIANLRQNSDAPKNAIK